MDIKEKTVLDIDTVPTELWETRWKSLLYNKNMIEGCKGFLKVPTNIDNVAKNVTSLIDSRYRSRLFSILDIIESFLVC